MPEELWTEVHDIAQESVIKTIPKKKKSKKAKWYTEEAFVTQQCTELNAVSDFGMSIMCLQMDYFKVIMLPCSGPGK